MSHNLIAKNALEIPIQKRSANDLAFVLIAFNSGVIFKTTLKICRKGPFERRLSHPNKVAALRFPSIFHTSNMHFYPLNKFL